MAEVTEQVLQYIDVVRFVLFPYYNYTLPVSYPEHGAGVFFSMLFAVLVLVCVLANNIQGMEEKKDYTVTQEQLARFAKVLGHPARIAIIHFLAKQKTCYFGDIHEELPIAKATVSQHLKELKDAGLIQGEVETPKVKYCINRENWQLARELFKEFFGQCICKSGECCR